MKNKINIAELLKDCPKDMELYSPLCGDCKLYDVNDYTIRIETPNKDTLISLHHDGRYCSNGEIMLFPKGKTTWEGFQRPFKDGDILYIRTSNQWICIYKEGGEKENVCHRYVAATSFIFVHDDSALCHRNNIKEIRHATEEEKAKLFKTIKDRGYKWNAETKTLKKLFEPKFKVGDVIQDKDSYAVRITEVNEEDECYEYESMIAKGIGSIVFNHEDEWELVSNKFDINTLKPFDKMLTRANDNDAWVCNLYSHRIKDYYVFLNAELAPQCIPYNDNTKHLLGTTNDCDEYYKTWEK